MKAFYELADENQDGIMDCYLVLTKEYGEPLVGDYRGVQLAVINFTNKTAKKRAEELARIYCKSLETLTPMEIPSN